MIKVAVFASGNGTNAENLIRYFSVNKFIRIQFILTNNSNAGVIERAASLSIECKVVPKQNFAADAIRILEEEKTDYIILAGFLLLLPETIIQKYRGRIINIHPALLPHHGGKGFYGNNVHQAVISSGAIMSGITIHHVNEKFDDGEIIFQAACHVDKGETVDTLATKIHQLEYSYFPVVVKKFIMQESLR